MMRLFVEGKNAIVGAGAIVAKDVEPYAVIIGNPAMKIKNIAQNI